MKEKVRKYQIKAYYSTGDSFSNSDTEDIIEISWDNLDVAKANLKRIQEHYKQYEELESWRITQEAKQEILLNNSEKDWFVKKLIFISTKEEKGKKYRFIIDKNNCEKEKSQRGVITEEIDETTAQHQIILYTDDSKPFQFWCPWCGYFERLNSAEILHVDNDLKFKV
jgi:hypothetical protein